MWNSLCHFIVALYALMKRFHKLTSRWTYAALAVVPLILVPTSRLLPIKNDFFINMGPYDRLADACTFLSLESAPQHRAAFIEAYKDFFGVKNLTLVLSKEEYDLVFSQMREQDQLLAVDGCRVSNIVHARFFLRAKHFEVSMHHHLFADKLDLRILEGQYYPSSQPTEQHSHREAFIRYLLTSMNDAYNTQANLSTIKVTPMDATLRDYFLDHSDMSLRLVFLLAFISSPVWAMPAIFERDLGNGFIDTLLSTNNCHFAYYIYARYCWSLLYCLQLLVIAGLVVMAYLWVHLDYWLDLLTLLLMGLFLLYDFTVSYTWMHLMFGRRGAIAGFFLNLVSYLLTITLTDPYISTLPSDYPMAVASFKLLNSFLFPGILFEWILGLMVLNGQYLDDKLTFDKYAAFYPVDPNHYPIMAGLLAYFLAILITKTVICSKLYHAYWSKLQKWTLGSSLKIEPDSARFHPDPSGQQQVSENTSEGTMPSQQQRASASTSERLVALKFVNVKKKTGGRKFKIDSMTVLYERITVFYASDLQTSSSIICRLAAGYVRPDRGQVQLYPNKKKNAKVAFVVTENFALTTLTVVEYLKLFCVFQQVPASVMFNRMGTIIKILDLDSIVNTPTDQLTNFEQLKLGTAIALLGQCSVLVFDNPTKAVALEDKREFWAILLKLKSGGKAVFLTTSSMEEVDYVADYVTVFFNGSIQARGRPDELKRAHQREDFCLRISKTSLMSRQEIEEFFQKVATKKDSEKEEEARGKTNETDGQPKHRQNKVCVFKKDSFNEYIFTFKFDTDEQKKAMRKVLDALYEKRAKDAKAGAQIAVNSISLNTLKDTFETIFTSASQKRPDPIQPNVAPSEKRLGLAMDVSRRRAPTLLVIFTTMLWMRLKVIFSWPPWVLIGVIFWTVFIFAIYCLCYRGLVRYNIMTMGRADLAVDWATVANTFNGSLVKQEPGNSNSNKTLDYSAWICSAAHSFAEFAGNFRVAYRLTAEAQSTYNLQYFYNQFASYPELFDLMAPFVQIAQRELSARQVNFTFDLSYAGHFREGSDIFDLLQGTWLVTTSVAVGIIVSLRVIMADLDQLSRRGWLHLLRANGLAQSVYVWLQLVAYSLCNAIFLTSSIFICQLIIPPTSFRSALDWLYFLVFIGSLTLMDGIAMLIELFFSEQRFTAILLVVIIFQSYLANLFIAFSSWNISRATYIMLQAPAFLSPVGVIIGQLLRPFFLAYPPMTEHFKRFHANICHFIYFDNAGYSNLVLVWCWVAASFYALNLYYWRYIIYRYRKDEQRQVTFLRNLTKDVSLHQEAVAVMEALRLKPNPDADEAGDTEKLFVVKKLSHHSGVKPVENVSFVVKRGECFGVYGLRGAGKSRLLEVLAGVQPFEEGDFYLWDRKNGFGDTSEVASQEPRFKKTDPTCIAYCPAFNCIDPRLTVVESLTVFAQLRVVPKAQLWSQVRQVAELFHLDGVFSKKCSLLTQYEARLLNLAIAFIGSPKLVLLDHPSSSVEIFQKGSIWSILLSAKAAFSNVTIILASNFASEVEALCDRMAVMIQGSFHFIGPDHQLRAKHCKGFDISLKVTPAKLKETYYMFELRNQVAKMLPDVRSMSTHKYVLNYHLPGANIRWSAVFECLEVLRLKFSLETYTLNVASLNEMFYHYAKTITAKKKRKGSKTSGEVKKTKTKSKSSTSEGTPLDVSSKS